MKIINKFIITLYLIGINPTIVFADAYNNGNSNPFTHYEYTGSVNNQSNYSTYFSNKITSPMTLKKSKKYQSLIDNAQSLNGCWDKAGIAYNVDPWLLFSIAKVESGFKRNATNTNTNKSIDIGMMQINTIWLPTLHKFGIEKMDLLEPCTSVFVGAWIVAQNIRKFGYNQDGIGAYNSPGNITIRRNYARKVYSAYNELTHDFITQIR
jgi:soluble lytic murein transglycosylase-like protein